MTFTASNGVEIEDAPSGSIILASSEPYPCELTLRGFEALQEYFEHKADEELGRWRWPERPNYVVYPDTAKKYITQPAVIVINEDDGASAYCGKDGLYSATGTGAADVWAERAAAAYFEALPEEKPWQDAQLGDVWDLEFRTFEGLEIYYRAFVIEGPVFMLSDGSPYDLDAAAIRGGKLVMRLGDETDE